MHMAMCLAQHPGGMRNHAWFLLPICIYIVNMSAVEHNIVYVEVYLADVRCNAC